MFRKTPSRMLAKIAVKRRASQSEADQIEALLKGTAAEVQSWVTSHSGIMRGFGIIASAAHDNERIWFRWADNSYSSVTVNFCRSKVDIENDFGPNKQFRPGRSVNPKKLADVILVAALEALGDRDAD